MEAAGEGMFVSRREVQGGEEGMSVGKGVQAVYACPAVCESRTGCLSRARSGGDVSSSSCLHSSSRRSTGRQARGHGNENRGCE